MLVKCCKYLKNMMNIYAPNGSCINPFCQHFDNKSGVFPGQFSKNSIIPAFQDLKFCKIKLHSFSMISRLCENTVNIHIMKMQEHCCESVFCINLFLFTGIFGMTMGHEPLTLIKMTHSEQ